MYWRYWTLICITLFALFFLASCGRKGKLEAPEGSRYPKVYPKVIQPIEETNF